MRRGLRLAWKVFAVLLGLGCCIKSRVGAASASTTTRRCSASGATSAGPTSCRRTCARPSRRAWRTSTPSWAGRPSASSSAAAGRRTPWSQRGGRGSRYPGEDESAPTRDSESHLHLPFCCIAFCCIAFCTLTSLRSFWKLECRPRTLAGPWPALRLLANGTHLGVGQAEAAEGREQAPALEERRGSAARGHETHGAPLTLHIKGYTKNTLSYY